jgi:hypothetical protein
MRDASYSIDSIRLMEPSDLVGLERGPNSASYQNYLCDHLLKPINELTSEQSVEEHDKHPAAPASAIRH